MAKKKAAEKKMASVSRTAVQMTARGPIVVDKEWQRHEGSKDPWKEASSQWGYLLPCLGIAWGKDDEGACRRTLTTLTEGGRSRHRSQIVVGGQLLIVDFGYADKWIFGAGDKKEEKPAYVMTVIGGTHPSVETPLTDLSKTPETFKRLWIRRFIYSDGQWQEDEPRFVRGKVVNSNPEWTVQPGQVTGLIFSTDPGTSLGNRPLLGFGIEGNDAVQMHDLAAEFGDKKLVPTGKDDEVQVCCSKWAGVGSVLKDFTMRRIAANDQMQSEGHAPFYLELECEEGIFQDRFGEDEKMKRFLTFQSVDGVNWSNPITSKLPYGRAGVSTEAVEREFLAEADVEKTEEEKPPEEKKD